MIEAIAAVICVAIGFLLNEGATRLREEFREKKQIKSARAIIRLEIDRNLAILNKFWSRVTELAEQATNPEKQAIAFANNFVEAPLQEWKQVALQSQLSFLPVALTEQEVIRVFHFYDECNKLWMLRNQLTAAMQEQREEVNLATVGGTAAGLGRTLQYLPPRPFDELAPKAWSECKEIVFPLLAEGNPLK